MDENKSPDSRHSQGAHFFSLPRELRDTIYELCTPDLIRIDRGEHPPWLIASKQIFYEATETAYNKTPLYQRITPGISHDLISQLWLGYASSVPFAELDIAKSTFPYAKRMITTVVVDVDVDLTVDDLSRLSECYCHRLGELTGLRKLYVQLTPYSGPTWERFRREIQMSELRIFHIANLMRAVGRLRECVPKGCEIIWAIPEEIRAYLPPSNSVTQGIRADVEAFMNEVCDALAAT